MIYSNEYKNACSKNNQKMLVPFLKTFSSQGFLDITFSFSYFCSDSLVFVNLSYLNQPSNVGIHKSLDWTLLFLLHKLSLDNFFLGVTSTKLQFTYQQFNYLYLHSFDIQAYISNFPHNISVQNLKCT